MKKSGWLFALVLAGFPAAQGFPSRQERGQDARAAQAAPLAAAFVSGGDYFSVAETEIAGAKTSVTACLYLFDIQANFSGSRPARLAEDLAAAVRRGVRVTVILDGSGDALEDGNASPSLGRNRAAYDVLSGRGVEVYFSSAPVTVHAKALVIDESDVLIGSSNWSEAALSRNIEANLLVKDPEVARRVLDEIGRAGRRSLPPDEAPAARVPYSFFSNPGSLGAMSRASDMRAFDVYLYLLKIGGGKESFPLASGPLAESLGVGGMAPSAARRQIAKTLGKLETKYGLIRSTTSFKGDWTVSVLPSTGTAVGLPAGYWDWGWCRRFSSPGKVMYLLNRYYLLLSPHPPSWSAAVSEIARERGVSKGVIGQGTMELRRANLVEVDYSPLGNEADSSREPSGYTPRALYDPTELDRAWVDLGKRYGGEKLARGRACAELVYEDSDPGIVEDFIRLEEACGRENVQKGYDLIAAKAPDNPHRCAAYFIAVVKNLKAGGPAAE